MLSGILDWIGDWCSFIESLERAKFVCEDTEALDYFKRRKRLPAVFIRRYEFSFLVTKSLEPLGEDFTRQLREGRV